MTLSFKIPRLGSTTVDLPKVVRIIASALCLTAVTVTFVSLSPSSPSGGRRLLMDVERTRAARLAKYGHYGHMDVHSAPTGASRAPMQPPSQDTSDENAPETHNQKEYDEDDDANWPASDADDWDQCGDCNGTGYFRESSIVCKTCDGTGNTGTWCEDDGGDDGWGSPNDGDWSDGAQAQECHSSARTFSHKADLDLARPADKDYKLLSQKMLRSQILEDAKALVESLGLTGTDDLSPLAAEHLLRFHNWNPTKARNAWFAGSERAKTDAGIRPPNDPVQLEEGDAEGTYECAVCMDDFLPDEFYAAECGHQVCHGCWRDIFGNSPDQKFEKSDVDLPCPEAGCGAKLSPEMFDKYLSPEDKPRYERFRLDDYVGNDRGLKWCPGKDCTVACETKASMVRNVHCSGVEGACGTHFCSEKRCNGQAHRPAPCATAKKWLEKSGDEALNKQYILANTKECPHCKIPIEKNDGCMHMTCRPPGCGFQFCWLCKGDWRETHGVATGGFYKCNIYEALRAAGGMTQEERMALRAKNTLEKYQFFQHRFEAQVDAIKFAEDTRAEKLSKNGMIAKLTAEYSSVHKNRGQFEPSMLEAYLLPALDTVIECRRLLAWTYPIQYYMDSDKDFHREQPNGKRMFDNHQEDLEKFLDTLHELCEQDYEKCCGCQGTKKDSSFEETDHCDTCGNTVEVPCLKKFCTKFPTPVLSLVADNPHMHTCTKPCPRCACEYCNGSGEGALMYEFTREKIIKLTRFVKTYRVNMVEGMEKILDDEGTGVFRRTEREDAMYES